MNRLSDATSPYLLQHADNPVDWWPWGPEAFAEAKRRDVPLLISVGYAACHWCHVMAHESFENEAVARVVNATTVPIKVDREERPDVDAVYMSATQALTGQGGWPMTVFATPDGEPFLCGTYFPRGHFVRLVEAVGDAWRDQRDALLRQSGAVVKALADLTVRDGRSIGAPTAPALDAAAASLARDHDEVHGGFGGAPKFPPHMALLFLLRHHQRTGDAGSLEIARHTAEAMARGGMYDQLGGGFARYSVDERWLVPHFEKMLYDNALLLRAYTALWRLTGEPLAERVARETAEFLVRDLGTDQGGFASSLDADTAGVEGSTYVWTPEQLRDALGGDDGAWAADLFGVTEEGTFEHGTSVLRLARDADSFDPEVRERWRNVRRRLYEARQSRPQPGRDGKVVAAWNGLAITALVEFGMAFSDWAARDAARRAAELLADLHTVDGRLRRVSLAGTLGEPAGVLEDYGAVAEAFAATHQLTADGAWLDRAGALLDTALARFADGADGFYDTADDAERLVARPADPTDNATPSGLSATAAALVAYSALTGRTAYREAAERALGTIEPIIARHTRFAGYAAATAEALVSGPFEIAIAGLAGTGGAGPAGTGGAGPAGTGGAGPAGTGGAAAEIAVVGAAPDLVTAAWRHAPPGAVIVAGEPDRPGVPLLADRPLRDGLPTAYVCRGFVCDRPVTSVDELVAKLAGT